MQSPAIVKIKSKQSTFTPTENEISQYVIKNQKSVVNSTISEIAEKTGVSEASVNRFVRKIGYKGFNDFKIDLAQQQFQQELYDSEGDDSNVIKSISEDYHQMIINSASLIEKSQVNKCLKLMRESKMVRIISLNYNCYAAQEFAFKLESVGYKVKLDTDIINIQLTASNIDKDDLVFVLAPSFQTKDIFPFVTRAKDQGAKIIAITSHNFKKLDEIVDLKFIIPDSNTTRNSLTLTNTLMTLFVTDVIFESLLRADKNLRDKRLNSDTIINNSQVINYYYYDMQ